MRRRLLACLAFVACREPAPTSVGAPSPAAAAPRTASACVTSDEDLGLRCWVEHLAGPEMAGRDNGGAGGRLARASLVEAFTAWGLDPAGETGTFEQALPRGANVLARVRGREAARADQHVVLAAHYDHLGVIEGVLYPGADDNASGVAILLAVTRRLATEAPARSVLVAAFDAEEPPDYRHESMGSNYFLAHPTVAREQIVAVVCLDLMGGDRWPGHRSPLYVMGLETFAVPPPLAPRDDPRLPVRAMHLRLVEDLPGGRQAFSDHGAFWQAEIPALFLSTGRSPHYHRPSDTPDRVHFDKLAAGALVVEALVRAIADMPDRPAWSHDQPVRAGDAATLADLLAAALGPPRAPEVPEFAAARLQDDLALARELAAARDRLSSADASALVAASLRLQCLLAHDDELPAAMCLL